jgi:DNA-binding MurR/RpiR family transcriptional regulator
MSAPDSVWSDGVVVASITDLVAQAADRLTPVERHLAEFVASNPTALAFATAAELAASVGVSRPSVVRFAVKLGFDGYGALQEHIRSQVTLQLKRPTERIRRDADEGPSFANLQEALSLLTTDANAGKIATAAGELARARAVWLVSGETSTAGAQTFLSGLSILRTNVALLTERTAVRDLASVERGDVGVAIGFYRYRRWAVEVTQALADRRATVIAISDGPFSPLARNAKVRFDLTIPALGPFDSSVPPVAAAELLVAATAKALGQKATKRIDRIEAIWQATSTFIREV